MEEFPVSTYLILEIWYVINLLMEFINTEIVLYIHQIGVLIQTAHIYMVIASRLTPDTH